MHSTIYQNQSNKLEQEKNLNIVCYKKLDNQQYFGEIQQIYEELFRRQTQQVIVGYLSIIEKEKEKENFSELYTTMQEIEFKRQSYPQIRQILIILHYTQINDNHHPIIIIDRAHNQFEGNPILNNEDQMCKTIELKDALAKYKEATNSVINAFDIFEKVEDEDFNKLYFMCLIEAKLRDCDCLLVQVNGNKKLQMNNGKFASRILKIVEQFE